MNKQSYVLPIKDAIWFLMSLNGDEFQVVPCDVPGSIQVNINHAGSGDPSILLPGIRNLLPAKGCVGSHGWQSLRETAALYRSALSEMIEDPEAVPPMPDCSGDGILYVGAGRYWPGIVVGCKLLRMLGCSLPIEVWYRGKSEEINAEDIQGLGVRLFDIDEISEADAGLRILGGWESKAYALVHTKLRRVLYLDADAYCVQDPSEFIKSCNEGFCFWEDLDSSGMAYNSEMISPETTHRIKLQKSVQGGQLVINRDKAWRFLCVAHWVNQHSDFYYSHAYGDQDVWKLLLENMECSFESFGAAPWVHPAFVVNDRNGRSLIVHRCQSKLFALGSIPTDPSRRLPHSTPFYHLPMEAEVFTLLRSVIPAISPEEAFGQIYQKRLWGDAGSGEGSSPAEAGFYVQWINQFIAENEIQDLLDCGSGDGRVAAQIQCKQFTGVEVVQGQVDRLKTLMPDRQWIQSDFFANRRMLPAATLLLIKDVLHHWPNSMVVDFLEWVIYSGRYKYIVVCGDCRQLTPMQDCPIGMYRALDEKMEPLSRYGGQRKLSFLHKSIVVFDGGHNERSRRQAS